jgi:CheY-like chemotaxis protein
MKKDKKNWTILIVEDQADAQDVYIMNLSKAFKDAFVIGVHSAKQAKEILGDKNKCKALILERYKDHDDFKAYEKDIEDNPQIINIGCIILDIVMETTKSGFDVIDYVRSELKDNNIQIIINSGQIGEGKEIPEDIPTLMKQYNVHSIILKGGNSDSVSSPLEVATTSAYRLYKALYQLDKQNELLKKLHENLKSIIFNEE